MKGIATVEVARYDIKAVLASQIAGPRALCQKASKILTLAGRSPARRSLRRDCRTAKGADSWGFVAARNFAKRLKALRWRTPYQVICEAWTKDPSIFKINPHHLIPGPHT
jgi:hypothetical protein